MDLELDIILFSYSTINPSIIKDLESKGTICLVLFDPGTARVGIKRLINEYENTYFGKTPQLLTWIEGSKQHANEILLKYKKLLAKGNIKFVDSNGNLHRSE